MLNSDYSSIQIPKNFVQADPPTNKAFICLSEKRFGNVKALEYAGYCKVGYQKAHCWLSLCACGNRFIARSSNLTRSSHKCIECGISKNAERQTVRVDGLRMTEHPLYHNYRAMIRRCYDKKILDYKDYGHRGIKVCKRWLGPDGFPHFVADMGTKPTPKHSIDRIDVNGNYSPENCRWASIDEQANNKRNSVKYTLDGTTRTLAQWASRIGVSSATLSERIHRGWDLSKALTTPKISKTQPTVLLTVDGESKPVKEWASVSPVSEQTIRGRVSKGWSHRQAVLTPLGEKRIGC